MHFPQDNFSDPEIRYKDAPQAPDKFRPILDRYFKSYSIAAINQRDRAEINSENYKTAISIAGARRLFLLRKFKTMTDPEQIDFFLLLLQKLCRLNLPVSQTVKSLADANFIRHEGNYWALFEFIAGAHFTPSLAALKHVAESLAALHITFCKLAPEEISYIDELSRKSQTYFNKIKTYSAKDFLSYALLDAVAVVEREKNAIDILPKQIIHSDFHPHNVIMNEDRVAAILDFDAMRISQRAREVAVTAYRFCRQFFVGDRSFDKDAKSIFTFFLTSYEAINPLSPEEKRLLPTLLKDEFLTKLLFVLKGVYEEGNSAWAADLPKFLSAIAEVDYFL